MPRPPRASCLPRSRVPPRRSRSPPFSSPAYWRGRRHRRQPMGSRLAQRVGISGSPLTLRWSHSRHVALQQAGPPGAAAEPLVRRGAGGGRRGGGERAGRRTGAWWRGGGERLQGLGQKVPPLSSLLWRLPSPRNSLPSAPVP